ncbi:MAG: SPFH domain-containing protein, partial [bacterium]|nr:SPFH domain-containing protein [bacterium]
MIQLMRSGQKKDCNINEARVLQLFGKYVGTAGLPGLRWANPLYSKKKVSLRIRNFETGRMKVNDIDGNPIEIASIVVWKVVDTAEACFEVDNYAEFVKIQSEAAVRNLATQYAYDSNNDDVLSLRGS